MGLKVWDSRRRRAGSTPTTTLDAHIIQARRDGIRSCARMASPSAALSTLTANGNACAHAVEASGISCAAAQAIQLLSWISSGPPDRRCCDRLVWYFWSWRRACQRAHHKNGVADVSHSLSACQLGRAGCYRVARPLLAAIALRSSAAQRRTAVWIVRACQPCKKKDVAFGK